MVKHFKTYRVTKGYVQIGKDDDLPAFSIPEGAIIEAASVADTGLYTVRSPDMYVKNGRKEVDINFSILGVEPIGGDDVAKVQKVDVEVVGDDEILGVDYYSPELDNLVNQFELELEQLDLQQGLESEFDQTDHEIDPLFTPLDETDQLIDELFGVEGFEVDDIFGMGADLDLTGL